MKSKIFILIMFLGLYGCGSKSPKFYTEVNRLQKNIKNEINRKQTKDLKEIQVKSPDVNYIVFKQMENELKSTNHIICYYRKNLDFAFKKFWYTIYDVENDIYYRLESLNSNPTEAY